MRVVMRRKREQLSKGCSEEDPIFEYEEEKKIDNLDDRYLWKIKLG